MSARVHQIKRKHSAKEIIIQRIKFAIFNSPMHTTCKYTVMATRLQNSLCLPNMTPPQHIKYGPYEIHKFNTP